MFVVYRQLLNKYLNKGSISPIGFIPLDVLNISYSWLGSDNYTKVFLLVVVLRIVGLIYRGKLDFFN